VALNDQQKMAFVYHIHWESMLPLTLSLSDSETKIFCRLARQRRAPQYNSVLARSLRRRPMAVRRSRPRGQRHPHPPPFGQVPVVAIRPASRRHRARGSMATAPAIERAPVLHWWCRYVPGFACRPGGTERSTENGLRLSYSPIALCSSFVGESYSKGRLRVSNGLCKDSIMMQSTKPSNCDF
jgi:hypothetical protein